MSSPSNALSLVSNNFPIDARMSSGVSTDDDHQSIQASYEYGFDNKSESSITSALDTMINCTYEYKRFE